MYWSLSFRSAAIAASIVLFAAKISAQQPSPETIQKVMERLDVLEKQNDELLKEIKALREELKSPSQQEQAQEGSQPLSERVDANEQRAKDLSVTKVGASQRFPISLTGMFLFDSYAGTGTKNAAYLDNYTSYSLGGSSGGATLRQSIIGLDFFGPHIFGGGQIHGTLAMDFYSGSSEDILRIRRGVVSFDWRRRSITFGQDKPLIAPLQPTSFARVGVPPLSGSGNLWLWLPQVRYEERIPLSPSTQIIAQASLLQTDESYAYAAPPANSYTASPRPAAEARVQLQQSWNEQARFTVGFGGHTSTTHLFGQSIPSRVVSMDFEYKPKNWLQVSGTILHGENFANLGGLPYGVAIRDQRLIAIRGSAGWLQLALPVTNRLTLDFYEGRQLNAARDLGPYDAFRTLTYAGNVLYRLSPNVVLGFEGAQSRLQYRIGGSIVTERYDATIAYLF